MKRFSEYFLKPDDYFSQSYNEYTPLGRFVISSVVSIPFIIPSILAVSCLANQAFENGDTTNLVRARSRECTLEDRGLTLDGLQMAQEHADTHGGPDAVCYIKAENGEGLIWYKVGS